LQEVVFFNKTVPIVEKLKSCNFDSEPIKFCFHQENNMSSVELRILEIQAAFSNISIVLKCK